MYMSVEFQTAFSVWLCFGKKNTYARMCKKQWVGTLPNHSDYLWGEGSDDSLCVSIFRPLIVLFHGKFLKFYQKHSYLNKRLQRCIPGERCLLQGYQTEGHASRGHQLPNIWSFEPESCTQVGNSRTHHSVLFPMPQGPFECFCDVDGLSFLMNEDMWLQSCVSAFDSDFSGSLAADSLPASCLLSE